MITVNNLIGAYCTDVDSPFRKLRFHTRVHYGALCKRISQDLGTLTLGEIKARQLLHWHEQFLTSGKVAMGHSVIGMLRILAGFGATILENDECVRLSLVLSKMRFTMSKPRNERLTAAQAITIRATAHSMNLRSIALAQALQFELMLRQKDVIGEWVPLSEPGISDVEAYGDKWLRGLRWEEIDADFILTHITSKRQKEIVVDLKLADMVLQELVLWFGAMDRSRMPVSGPVILSELTEKPWRATEFRRQWRMLADKCGIPRTVKNMDTRAGAISEATDAGADLEHVRHAATHSDIGMTQRYSRGGEEKTAGVMRLRVASRQNKA